MLSAMRRLLASPVDRYGAKSWITVGPPAGVARPGVPGVPGVPGAAGRGETTGTGVPTTGVARVAVAATLASGVPRVAVELTVAAMAATAMTVGVAAACGRPSPTGLPQAVRST